MSDYNPQDHSTTAIGEGEKDVTTAGTPEALASTTRAKWVIVQAKAANTDYVAVGGASVDAGTTGIALAPGESVTLPIDNLADVYVDAVVSGEGVRFTYGA